MTIAGGMYAATFVLAFAYAAYAYLADEDREGSLPLFGFSFRPCLVAFVDCRLQHSISDR